jgi:hypothetical protein
MKYQSMQKLDEEILEALSPAEASLLEPFRNDPPIFEMLIETFRGRNRWLNGLAFMFTFIGLAMVAVAGYQFFQAESTRAMIAWATCFLWFVVWVAMLKMWFWLEMQRNSITREIKRLELQVAHLSQRT